MSAPTNTPGVLPAGVDPAVVRSIRQASASSSADFGLLMAQAQQESSFQPDAKASTSSATGLYQFIDSTWLDMVRQFGAKYGIGDLAQQVTVDASGKSVVADKSVRQQILELRKDPQISAALAGEYTQQNKAEIERGLGHSVPRAALYMAHFLGAGGATTFLKAVESKGATVAAQLLPDAAAANHNIFYDKETGAAKTVAQIYHSLADHIEHEAQALTNAGPATATDLADTTTSAPTTASLAANILASLPTATEPTVSGVPGAGSVAAFRAFGSVGWSGGKLSEPLMAMLNVMSLAALKLADEAKHPEPASTAPKPRTPAIQAELRPHRGLG
jgi:hypothetical protein